LVVISLLHIFYEKFFKRLNPFSLFSYPAENSCRELATLGAANGGRAPQRAALGVAAAAGHPRASQREAVHHARGRGQLTGGALLQDTHGGDPLR